MLTRTAGYALHAALVMAEGDGAERPSWRAHEIAAALDIPSNYLAKILQTLARAGVLESERGRAGGFRLARPPAETPLLSVISPFDDVVAGRRRCVLGQGACSEAGSCPVHAEWRAVSTPAYRFFEGRTLADLAGPGGRHRVPPDGG